MSNQNPVPDTAATSESTVPSPGLRLRQARLDAGLSIADVAGRLRLRTSVIEAIEHEDLAALGAPVFARGFVDGYVSLMGLPDSLVDELLPREDAVQAPPQLPSNSMRQMRNRALVDRFARRFVYVALTASIVVPVVLLATREPLPDPATLLTPPEVFDELVLDNAMERPAPAEDVGPPAEQAVMASFTPFHAISRNTAAPASPVPVEAPAPAGLVLKLAADSWVEVIGVDGSRLTHDLLRAGARRSFDPDEVSHVVLGNAAGVKVSLNGQELDIAPFQRANVARFAVSSDGSLMPAGG